MRCPRCNDKMYVVKANGKGHWYCSRCLYDGKEVDETEEKETTKDEVFNKLQKINTKKELDK